MTDSPIDAKVRIQRLANDSVEALGYFDPTPRRVRKSKDAIDALRDEALRLATLLDEGASLVREGLGHIVTLQQENARLITEVKELHAEIVSCDGDAHD